MRRAEAGEFFVSKERGIESEQVRNMQRVLLGCARDFTHVGPAQMEGFLDVRQASLGTDKGYISF